MRRYTYIRTCKKCGEEFKTNNPLQRLHPECKAKRQKRGREFHKKRIDVLIRDNQTCQHCGFDFKQDGDSIKIHAHHIDGNPNNNDINNLVILCAKCHRLAHHHDLTFKFKKNFKPKEYKEKLVKTDKFLFKNID